MAECYSEIPAAGAKGPASHGDTIDTPTVRPNACAID